MDSVATRPWRFEAIRKSGIRSIPTFSTDECDGWSFASRRMILTKERDVRAHRCGA
jgi:hypothetical protein